MHRAVKCTLFVFNLCCDYYTLNTYNNFSGWKTYPFPNFAVLTPFSMYLLHELRIHLGIQVPHGEVTGWKYDFWHEWKLLIYEGVGSLAGMLKWAIMHRPSNWGSMMHAWHMKAPFIPPDPWAMDPMFLYVYRMWYTDVHQTGTGCIFTFDYIQTE